MPKLTPPLRPPCIRCGQPTPHRDRKWCEACLLAERLRRCKAKVKPRAVAASELEPPKQSPSPIVRPTICGHCGGKGSQLFWESQDSVWGCLGCGWRSLPAELLPLVRERQGQQPGIRGGTA